MGRQADKAANSQNDWDEDEDENLLMDDELDLEFDADEDDGDTESESMAAKVISRRGEAWRMIEQAREQRALRVALEDFDDYVV